MAQNPSAADQVLEPCHKVKVRRHTDLVEAQRCVVAYPLMVRQTAQSLAPVHICYSVELQRAEHCMVMVHVSKAVLVVAQDLVMAVQLVSEEHTHSRLALAWEHTHLSSLTSGVSEVGL